MVSLLYNNTNCMTNLDIDYRDIYRLIPTLPPPESINSKSISLGYTKSMFTSGPILNSAFGRGDYQAAGLSKII